MTSRTLGNARLAVSLLFFTNGALFANLVPRYPEVKAALGLGNTVYGLVVAAFSAGALVAGLAAATLIRRFSSAAVAVGGTLVTAACLVLAGVAPSAAVFASALFLAGAADALTDVGQNAHGLRVQRHMGRSIINSFHAIWSIGAVTGGAMAAGAIALDLPLGLHLGLAAMVFAVVALVAGRFCLPAADTVPVPQDDDERPAGHSPATTSATTGGATAGTLERTAMRRTVLVLAALVLIATAGTTVEDAGNSWAALYLADSLGAAPTVAATGFVALVGFQFVGRLVGDRLVDRWGQRAVARTGGALVALGMGLALAFPTVTGTVAGFGAAGLGVATLVPAAMHQADGLPGLRHGTGLTVVSWLMRVGFLLSPPIVGAIADATSLRAGLLVVPLAGLVVVLLAGVLSPRSAAERSPAASRAES